MIDRYTTPEMTRIWSEQNKFETWKKVEITVTEVLSDRGEVPKEAVKVINEKAAFSIYQLIIHWCDSRNGGFYKWINLLYFYNKNQNNNLTFILFCLTCACAKNQIDVSSP